MTSDADFSFPTEDIFAPPTATFYYGAANVAARFCGLEEPPSYTRGIWQHGWVPEFLQFFPHSLIGQNFSPETWIWTGDDSGVRLCVSAGHRRALAIGLPIVYVPPAQVQREPNTLLVMPVHSGFRIDYKWNEEAYTNEIAAIAPSFARVIVSVHPTCWEKGYWVRAFERRGFRVIRGATAIDRNALVRLVRNLSRFEFMTTNGIGSHVAYAAYLGAKVSIFGSYAHTPEALASDIQDGYYQDHPEVVPLIYERFRFEYMSRVLSQFFRSPREAVDMVDWGRDQVGYRCRMTPAELIDLFLWRNWTQAGYRLIRLLPVGVARRIKLLLKRQFSR